jgi:hypothetical protein
MSDDVSVIGAGAATTTIDGTGSNNSVVIFYETRSNPTLSGFTITGGQGDRIRDIGNDPVFAGGGILILNSSPVISNTIITGNSLDQGYCLGGGIYVNSGLQATRIVNNVITNNSAISTTITGQGEGGGIFSLAKNTRVLIKGNRIESNQAVTGGAIHSDTVTGATIRIHENTIEGNDARDGAGLFINDSDSLPTQITNNLILGNGSIDSAARGGGIFINSIGTSSFEIANNTFANNSTPSGNGGALWIDDSSATSPSVIANNIFAENTALQGGAIDHTAYFGDIRNNDFHLNTGGDLYDGGGSGTVLVANIFTDPQFTSTVNSNYRLLASSPAIDTGDDTFTPLGDLDGFYRPYDGDSNATPISDMGAYEYPGGEVLGVGFQGDGISLDWELVPLVDSYNVYRGSLSRLRLLGEYTQDPLVEPMADVFCAQPQVALPFQDPYLPPAGEAVFYLVTVKITNWESALGTDTVGMIRPNANSCP